MNCKEVHKKMNPYLSQELALEQLQSYEFHLKDCASCCKLYNEVKDTMSLVDQAVKLKADPYLFTRIQAQIDNRNNKLSRNWKKVLQPIAVVMIMGVGLLSGISLGSKYYNDSFYLNTDESLIDSQDEDLYLNALAYESIESFLLTEN